MRTQAYNEVQINVVVLAAEVDRYRTPLSFRRHPLRSPTKVAAQRGR